jgi:hypothetical protein
MKSTHVIYALSLIAAVVLLPTAHALDRIPVKTVICYPAAGLASWTYRFSGDTLNGAPDQKGYVFLNFKRYRKPNGQIIQTNVQHPLNALSWDANFSHIVATGQAGQPPITCGTVIHGVVQKLEQNCRLEGRIIPSGPCPTVCGDDPSYLFDGELLIER